VTVVHAVNVSTTRRRVEFSCVAIDTSPTQLDVESSRVELCRYKRAFTHTPDPIRPTRRGPDPNRPTNGSKQGGYDLGGVCPGAFGRTYSYIVEQLIELNIEISLLFSFFSRYTV